MKSFSQFLAESDEFVLAWNQYTAKHPKEARPIPTEFKRFSKYSKTKASKGYRRGCWFNALDNYHKKGWKVIGGFAIDEDDVQRLLKTGEISWNTQFRGYEHAWNIDADGAIIDSTYENPEKYRYYGLVVPEITLKGIENDSDKLMSWVSKKVGQHDTHPMLKNAGNHFAQNQKPTNIKMELPPDVMKKIEEKGFKFHSITSNSGSVYHYLFLNRKTTSKMYLTYDFKTKKSTVEVEKIPNGGDAGKVKKWVAQDWEGGRNAVDVWFDNPNTPNTR